jgi:hypothetical protein
LPIGSPTAVTAHGGGQTDADPVEAFVHPVGQIVETVVCPVLPSRLDASTVGR